jgi:hypothetical protein
MEISPFLLTLLLSWSLAFGLILGVLNDVNRIIRVFGGVKYSEKRFGKLYELVLPVVHQPLLRKENKFHKKALAVLIFFQDIIFFIVASIGIILLNYEFNEGRFRFFVVVAVILGFLLYYFTVGKVVMAVSEGIVFFIKSTLLVVFSVVFRPFAIFGGFLMKKITLFSNIAIANIQKKWYNKYKKKDIIHKSLNGFLKIKK